MKIEPFIHRCTIRSGSLAGNKTAHEVTPHEAEYRETCEHCGEPYVDPDALLAHIYDQLLTQQVERDIRFTQELQAMPRL